MFFIVCAVVTALPTAAFLWERIARREPTQTTTRRARIRSLGPWLLVGGLLVAYGSWFSRLAINNHHALQTRIFDLAIYDNIFFQSSHGNPLGCSLSRSGTHIVGHFDPILVLLSPLYHLYPRAELILVLQAFWCAAGVIPAYLLGKHHMRSVGAGLTLATAWALYPALHGANLYEFHSLTLLAMPLLWLLYFLTSGRLRAFFVLLPFVLLVREDVSLLVGCIGAAAVLTREPKLVRAGWITAVVSVVYFLVVKLYVMGGVQPGPVTTNIDPLGGKHGFGWYYRDLIPKRGGLRDLLLSLVTNPAFVLELALREAKLVYLLQLLLPLGFLPLFGKPWRFAAAFGLFYTLLATRKPVYTIHFQYSIVLFPVLFALTPIALRRLKDTQWPIRLGLAQRQWTCTALVAVLASSILMSWKFGGAVPNAAFRGGWARIPHVLTPAQEKRYEELREFLNQIPPDASVTTVGRVGPHVSNRAEVYQYRHRRPSDFLVFDKRDLKSRIKKVHQKDLDGGKIELVAERGTFQLFRPTAEQGEPEQSGEP